MKRCAQFLKNEGQCPNVASYRYTWPEKAEAVICETCAAGLRRVAAIEKIDLELVELQAGGL